MTGGSRAAGRGRSVEDYVAEPPAAPDRRIAYGAGSSRFGDLFLPGAGRARAVVVVVHGGCWLPEYGLEPLGGFCRALAGSLDAAVWSLEYNRTGQPEGGWPGTFLDVSAGFDHVASLAAGLGLDAGRVVVVGHSAGGQLALWVAARPRVPVGSPVRRRCRVRPRGVVALAPVTDLLAGADRGICGDAIPGLLGAGLPADRVAAVSPAHLLPLGVPQTLVSGLLDEIVPPDGIRDYARAASLSGDAVTLVELEGAGHFDLVDFRSPSFGPVRDAIGAAIGSDGDQP